MTKPFFATEKSKIFCADSRAMSSVNNESVHLIITSPPYWNLKNYKESSQIGLGQSYEQYLEELEKVLKECGRVLKSGHYFALIIGTRVSDGELRHIPADCIGICKKYNLKLKKEIIWTKPKGTQGLWQRGVTQFLKSKPYPRNANFNIQHEFILIFQKDSILSQEQVFNSGSLERLSEEFIKEVAWSNWQLKVSYQKGHPAPFPVELPLRLIKLYSYPGEIVLDPFMGSGTTAIASEQLNRFCIGYDISEKFCQLAKENLIGHLANQKIL